MSTTNSGWGGAANVFPIGGGVPEVLQRSFMTLKNKIVKQKKISQKKKHNQPGFQIRHNP